VSRFWPPREACQVEYERLREQVLVGVDELYLASSRFRRLGLAALISSPTVESRLVASVLGARRPRWSGLEDPRLDALAGAYSLLTRRLDGNVVDDPGPWVSAASGGRA
jgi:hypothetical protein